MDATALREAMARFARSLAVHEQELNSLNVFPVADGDTGTNLLLTQRAVAASIAGDRGGMADVARAISREALLAARGSSGVILAQALRGLCDALAGAGAGRARSLAGALERAATEARRAVSRPVDGTALSVLGDAAAAARRAAGDGAGGPEVAERALQAARESLARTPTQLAVLGEANVVDAGGKGVVLLLDAIASTLSGRRMSDDIGPPGPVGRVAAERPDASGRRYEMVWLSECEEAVASTIRDALDAVGDSVVVAGGGGLYKLHVHTDDEVAVRAIARDNGRPRDVQVVDLREQMAQGCLAGRARAVQMGERQRAALVAVAEGDGFTEILRSLGALVVTPDSASGERLLEVIASAPAESVLLVAERPHDLAKPLGMPQKRVTVAPSPSPAATVCAAAAFNPARDAAWNRAAVRDAMAAAAFGAIPLYEKDPPGAAAALARRLRSELHEVLSLYVGDTPHGKETARVEAAIRDAVPDLRVDVHAGGQRDARYLVAVE